MVRGMDSRLLSTARAGGHMAAKTATAPAQKMTMHTKLKTVDALFVLAFGIFTIATVVAIGLR
jgi:hypothetical protein